jgi:hypothetical protein
MSELKWSRNKSGSLGVSIDIQLSIIPQMMVNSKCVELPGFQPVLHFFIKEFRFTYSTEQFAEYLEDMIEQYMYNIYPQNETLAEEAAEALVEPLITYLTPYIKYVREHGLQDDVPKSKLSQTIGELPKNEGAFAKALEKEMELFKAGIITQMELQLYSQNPILKFIESKSLNDPHPFSKLKVPIKSLHSSGNAIDVTNHSEYWVSPYKTPTPQLEEGDE